LPDGLLQCFYLDTIQRRQVGIEHHSLPAHKEDAPFDGLLVPGGLHHRINATHRR